MRGRRKCGLQGRTGRSRRAGTARAFAFQGAVSRMAGQSGYFGNNNNILQKPERQGISFSWYLAGEGPSCSKKSNETQNLLF